ncbi:MAG: hypothetical protein BGO67_03355 [Alphaproteobacteria bacterium 41-28]|nr:MAG: hypothetical protein BGO67_03355 [Alphaproteobacteria bacterium 41-28]
MLYIQTFFCIFLFSSSVYAGVTLAEEYEKDGLPPVNHQVAFLKEQLEKDIQKFNESEADQRDVEIPYTSREEAEGIMGYPLPKGIKFGKMNALQQTLQVGGVTLHPKELEFYKYTLGIMLLNFKNFFPGTQRPRRHGGAVNFEWPKTLQDLFRSVEPHLLDEFARLVPFSAYSNTGWIYGNCIDKMRSEIKHYKGLDTKTTEEAEPIIDEEFKRIFSYKYFGFEDESAREKYLTSRPFGFLSEKEIQEIYSSAFDLLNLSQENDTFVFFGNTPYWFGRAFESILKENPDHKRHVISFPFSGSPNRGRGKLPLNIDDCTTPERLEYLIGFLKKRGLSSDNPCLEKGKIYFVDNIGSGSGPAFVIEEFIRSYQEKKKSIPDISLITMGDLKSYLEENSIPGKKDKRPKEIYKGEGKVYFPSIAETHYTIDFFELGMTSAPASLDNVEGCERFYPSYNASRWNSEYAFLHELEPPTYMRNFTISFDGHIKKLIEADKGNSL